MKKIILIAVSMMAWSGCAFASMVEVGPYTSDLFAERPYLTEKAKVVEQGVFEMMGGYGMILSRANTITNNVRFHMNYGLTKDVTLGICFPYGGDYAGVDDAQLGFKYSLNSLVKTVFRKDDVFDLSIAYAFVLGSMDYTVKIIAGKDWGKFRAYANLGYVKHEIEKTCVSYGIAANFLAGKRWDLGTEVMGEIEREPGIPSSANVTIGAKYWVSDALNFDLGIGTGLISDPALYATMGFTLYTGQAQ